VSTLIERPDRLKLTRFADLVNHPPAPWLIRGVLRESSVAMLYGRRGCYKSFVALSMAGSVATGVPWMGHPVPNTGPVIYVAAEGGGGMVQRARALSEYLDIHPAKFDIHFVTEPMAVLRDSDDMELVVERIRELIDWEPAGSVDEETGYVHEHPVAREWPRLLVIDTLSRCLIGNENQQEDMAAFIQGVDRLKVEFDCTILIVHHTGINEDRPRGSTVHEAACDTVYSLEAGDGDDLSLLMDCKKMKDSVEPPVLEMVRRPVEVTPRPDDDPDESLSSVVIVPNDEDEEDRSAHMLLVLGEMGPMSWTNWLGSTGVPRTTFQRTVVELRKSGEIIKENNLWRVV
jgi:hypothetical protein